MKTETRRAVLAEAPAFQDELDRRLGNGGLDGGERAEVGDRIREILNACVAARMDPQGGPASAIEPIESRAREQEAAVAGGVELVRLSQRPREDLSEDGNALRFVADHSDVARYVPGPGWHLWDERRWQPDEDGAAVRLAKETARSLLREATLIEDDAEAKKVFAHHRASRKANAINAMLKLAQSEVALIAHADDLDADPWALNLLNGTLDLRSATLRSHERDDLLTKLAPVEWDPDAEAPRWLRFLDEVFKGDADLIAFVQRAFGYSLTGDTREQCLFFCWGEGGNGKTTLREVQRALAGDYGEIAASGSLMAKRADAIPNDLAGFRGARVLQSAETAQGAQLDEVLVKEVTGGDEVKARFLHKEWFSYRPAFKVWMVGNHRPKVKGTDDAVWDRIRLIPFGARLRGSAGEDKGLRAKLLEELPGVLAWAVEGCLAWQRDGLGEPPAVREATADYRAEQDTVTGFLAERCAFGTEQRATKANLFEAYKGYCGEVGAEPRSRNDLGRAVKGIEGVAEGRSGSTGRYWTGIGITTGE